MGKAAIISEAGDGLYTIEVRHDTSVADAQLAKLESMLATVDARITEESGKPKPDQSVISSLKLRKTAIEKRFDRVKEAAEADYQTQAWCADLTEGLAGEVGTIEPGAEMKNGINIRPGFDDGAVFVRERDGQATPFLTMDVADAMRNFAIMPAIQRWRPTYRYATISNIDTEADTCRVTLEPLFSSIRDLDINYQGAYDDVPVEYMSCNAAAFENGDAVIIRFDPYDVSGQPKVIGFKSNPKPCEIREFVIVRTQEMTGAAGTPAFIVWDPKTDNYAVHPDLDGISWPASFNDLATFFSKTAIVSSSVNINERVWNIDSLKGETDTSFSSIPSSRQSAFTLGGTYYASIDQHTVSQTFGDCDGDGQNDDLEEFDISQSVHLDAVQDYSFTQFVFSPGVSIGCTLQSAYLGSGMPLPVGGLAPWRIGYLLNRNWGRNGCLSAFDDGNIDVTFYTPIGSEGFKLATWEAGYQYEKHGDTKPQTYIYNGFRSDYGRQFYPSVFSGKTIVQTFMSLRKNFGGNYSGPDLYGDGGMTQETTYAVNAICSCQFFEDPEDPGGSPTNEIDPTTCSRSTAFETAVVGLAQSAFEADPGNWNYLAVDIREAA
ncbi:hypothetical protein [uncultured Desulfosarcina sp.]|uniref:hypothetical protein n=1 Tax=uncultured Desulfosarcina sp. TaxID=218289 RepID=UPI0029C7F4B2|nr:hypothetical protein [uncultured Desulfosarcina sp.]